MEKSTIKSGHFGSRRREVFGEGIEAYQGWNAGEPEPTVTLEPRYDFEGDPRDPGAAARNASKKDRVLTVSQVCGLLWNCTDILPSGIVQDLESCGIYCGEQYKRRTYGAAARAVKFSIAK